MLRYKNPVQGLKQAIAPQGPDSFDPANDPLGINVEGRARDNQFQYNLQHPSALGPLPDPKWQGFFQATAEAGGGKAPQFGYWEQPSADLSRSANWGHEVQEGMPLPVQALYKSQQLGTPVDRSHFLPRKGLE